MGDQELHDWLIVVGDLPYHQTSSISDTLGNEIVDHSDVVETVPVSAAPTTSSFSTDHLVSVDWAQTTARQNKKHSSFGILYLTVSCLTVVWFLTLNLHIRFEGSSLIEYYSLGLSHTSFTHPYSWFLIAKFRIVHVCHCKKRLCAILLR